MTLKEQHKIVESVYGDGWNYTVVCDNPDMAWNISSNDFANMTVIPSVDASASGHWHGNITNGEIVGGEQKT